mgnify:CR=1 FL=1
MATSDDIWEGAHCALPPGHPVLVWQPWVIPGTRSWLPRRHPVRVAVRQRKHAARLARARAAQHQRVLESVYALGGWAVPR